MRGFQDKVCLVWDSGLFISFAQHLSKDFGRTFYHSDVHYGPFPKSPEVKIGTGIEGVTRTDDPYTDVLHKFDKEDILIVFPDVYQVAGLQMDLRKQGYRVWGSGNATKFELDRKYGKELMEKVGIDVGPWTIVKGLSNLIEDIKEEKDFYVKLRYGNMRGTGETFRTHNWDYIQGYIKKELGPNLGESAETTEFIVEQPLKDCVEIGIDWTNIDGQYNKAGFMGIEKKAESLLGRWKTAEEMPRQAIDQLDRLAPYFKKSQLRNLFALESRFNKKGIAYGLDPCPRFSRPCSEALQAAIGNWADVCWFGAEGILIPMEKNGSHLAQVMVFSSKSERHGCTVTGKDGGKLPADCDDWLKLVNLAIVEGRREVLPGLSGIGAVVAVGNSESAVIKLAKERCDMIGGHGVEVSAGCLDSNAEEWTKLKDYGIEA